MADSLSAERLGQAGESKIDNNTPFQPDSEFIRQLEEKELREPQEQKKETRALIAYSALA
ncbi:MAG: hypothetical protein JWO52_210 [Gammaproteobacteria bacterium]|nr:hypothetical protein [Gammaproteobacteria bacterium]